MARQSFDVHFTYIRYSFLRKHENLETKTKNNILSVSSGQLFTDRKDPGEKLNKQIFFSTKTTC